MRTRTTEQVQDRVRMEESRSMFCPAACLICVCLYSKTTLSRATSSGALNSLAVSPSFAVPVSTQQPAQPTSAQFNNSFYSQSLTYFAHNKIGKLTKLGGSWKSWKSRWFSFHPRTGERQSVRVREVYRGRAACTDER